jgi:tripartite-type tricarboxylate transporter receptor subunit TctC
MRSAAIRAFVALAALLACAAPALSQYPAKTIRLIVPFAPGSVNDLVARLIAPPMSEALGQQLIVDNRPGVAGNLGAELAARSPADGYTLMMGNSSHAISVTLFEKPGYDFLKDFTPVSYLASGAYMLAVHPSLPVKSVKSLLALARARPGELNVSVAGAGVIAATELFKGTAGIRMTNVTYKGTPQILTALASGEVSVGLPPTSAAVPQVRSAKIRPLGVTSRQRSPMAPEIPTVGESGLPGFEATTWYCLLAPAGTPRDVVTRLNAEAARALARPDVKSRFNATDLTTQSSTPEELGKLLRSEVDKWGKVVKASGMRPD